MKLLMMIKDEEYSKALAKGLSINSNEIKITLCYELIDICAYDLVLSDYEVTDVIDRYGNKDVEKFVFLVNYLREDSIYKYENEYEEFQNYNFLFKYKELSFLKSDIMWYYYKVNCEYYCHPINGKLISIFSDNDVMVCNNYSKMLGRTLVNKYDKKILIFPLTYINSDAIKDDTVDTNFKKLIYNINLKRKFPLDPYFYKDSYGLYHFRSKEVLNPIPELYMKEFNGLVSCLMRDMFDVIIFDIGCNYSLNNLNVIKSSDRRILVCEDGNNNLKDMIMRKCDLDESDNMYRLHRDKHLMVAEENMDFDIRRISENILESVVNCG